ncbi:MAG: hypothetical protein CMJ94_12020 [Planctomycetes bacterium]|nr:hypothetical protein [Planctomycetota bacterium]
MLSPTLLLLFASPQATPEPAPAPANVWAKDVIAEDARQVMPRLKQLMREGLRRTEPDTNFVKRLTGDSLFQGSYDWHSNLFAHWALLTIARVEGDTELRDWLLEPLTLEAIAAERGRVNEIAKRERPLPTFPYDQGWLLLFLTEYEKTFEELPEEVRAFRLEVETRLLDWLENSPFPAQVSSRFEKGRYPGFYRSWLFSWYQVRLSQPISEKALERLATLQRERITLARDALLAQTEPHPFDFFYVPAMPTLIHAIAPFEGEAPALITPALTPLPEQVSLRDVHVLGTEVSHMWPLAARAHAGDTDAKAELNRRMTRFLAREDLWAEDFTVVTHWVPQFLWLTFWLADGRP